MNILILTGRFGMGHVAAAQAIQEEILARDPAASVVVADATMTCLCGTQEGALEHCEKCYGSALVTVDELEAALRA